MGMRVAYSMLYQFQERPEYFGKVGEATAGILGTWKSRRRASAPASPPASPTPSSFLLLAFHSPLFFSFWFNPFVIKEAVYSNISLNPIKFIPEKFH